MADGVGKLSDVNHNLTVAQYSHTASEEFLEHELHEIEMACPFSSTTTIMRMKL